MSTSKEDIDFDRACESEILSKILDVLKLFLEAERNAWQELYDYVKNREERVDEKIEVVAEALLEKEKDGELCPETRGKLYKITEEGW